MLLWDDTTCSVVGERSFPTTIIAIRMRRDRLVVVLEHSVHVFNLLDLALLGVFETYANSRGVVALSYHASNSVLAISGTTKGSVRVELFNDNKTTLILAHKSPLHLVSLNAEGSLLATASEKGTLIRLFNSHTGELLTELRRGSEKCTLYSVAFSSTSHWLLASSDRGTVHVFALKGNDKDKDKDDKDEQRRVSGNDRGVVGGPETTLEGTGRALSNSDRSFKKAGSNSGGSHNWLGNVANYFNSKWSYISFKSPDCPSISAFGSHGALKDTVLIVCADGRILRYSFNPDRPKDVKLVCESRFN